jgi:SAM-dependent methyltransferase
MFVMKGLMRLLFKKPSLKPPDENLCNQMPLVSWNQPFEVLRKKWHEVPAANSRVTTRELEVMSDKELLDLWLSIRSDATTGAKYNVRGWYHTLYCDIFKGKRVMDVGSGLGIDGITFAQHGARMTFIDILESNLAVLNRLCKLLGLSEVDFCYLKDLSSLSTLPTNYDVIWCQGSLINAPIEIIRAETQELLKHLPVGGRWIELAYPKIRWEREGKLPFEKWGGHTDGEGTPWVEWYDLSKIQAILEPAQFDVILNLEFHNSDFNWFDLIRRS